MISESNQAEIPKRGRPRKDGTRSTRPMPVRPGPGWYSVQEVADVFGLGINGVRQKITGYAGPGAREVVGGVEFFLVRALIDGHVQAETNKALRKVMATGAAAPGDEMLFTGGDSPWMEKYREERARIVAMQRLTMENDLLPREEVHRGYVRMAHRFRRLGEELERDYGVDARGALELVLDEMKAEVERAAGALDAEAAEKPKRARKRRGKSDD